MLNFSGRHRKFELLRAHWEAAELEGQRAEMVGRKERQTSHAIVHVEAQHNAGSNFRRKLSNGLAFISLTQRKPALTRQLASNASMAMNAPSANNSSTAILDQNISVSSQDELLEAKTSSSTTAPLLDGVRTSTILQSPTPLPRPRTFSYIPRPVKADAEVMSIVKKDDSAHDVLVSQLKTLPPTRIPTPNSRQPKRRVSSPRQYFPVQSPLQTVAAINCQSAADRANPSPSKVVVRSQTTPNLAKALITPQHADHIVPKRQETDVPPTCTPQRPLLDENTPTGKHVMQRRPQAQNRSVKRESLAMPPPASNRRSFGPSIPLVVQNKHISLAPPVSTKRLSSHFSHLAASYASAEEAQEISGDAESLRSSKGESGARRQSSNSGTVEPVNPPLVLPSNFIVENETQRRTLGTPSGLDGNWRSSRVFAAANHKVRRSFPRSSTFQHFGRSKVPPISSVPGQYESPSSSDLTQSIWKHAKPVSFSNLHHRLPTASGKFASSSGSLLSDIAIAQRSIEAVSLNSFSTRTSMDIPQSEEQPEAIHLKEALESLHGFQEASVSAQEANFVDYNTKVSAKSAIDPPARLTLPTKSQVQPVGRAISIPRPSFPAGELQTQRQWSILEYFYPGNADISTYFQVKDYMPPLYWAGRFQSRFDQWRTETMTAILNPTMKCKSDTPLGQCSLDDEKKATVLIFMQLRDLCTSTQAADSLHEFEYRYRKDHKLLDTKLDLPPSLRKPEESTPKGSIGRAVRKLTPRKASFVNLFKGKSRNRHDDTEAEDVPGHFRELQDITDLTSSFEAPDSDSCESSTRPNHF